MMKNGDNVYSRTLFFTIEPNSTTYTPHDISNIKRFIDVKVRVAKDDGDYFYQNYFESNSNMLRVLASKTRIYCHTGGTWEDFVGRVTLFYTCTDR